MFNVDNWPKCSKHWRSLFIKKIIVKVHIIVNATYRERCGEFKTKIYRTVSAIFGSKYTDEVYSRNRLFG